jgi:hypothetical protein
MQYRVTISLIILICAALAIAGCTGTPNTSAAPAAPATVSGTGSSGSSAGNMVVSPTDAIPEYNFVTADVGEKDYLGVIPVIFQGGMGQIHVKKIDVTLYRSDGSPPITTTMGIKKGDLVELVGTKQTDRVVVIVSMDNGQSYKINDVLSPYRTRQ